jgi:hypothetical protein
VFAGAWVMLIFPLHYLSGALSLVMLLLLLMLVGVLPYKLSDWAPVRGRLMEEADEA